MEVALRSSRTRTHGAVENISRMIGSSASERQFHASQSPFTLRQTRLTVSLPTSPPNTLRRARRTPARIGAGKIRTGDQRVGQPGCGADNSAAPGLFHFRRLAAGTVSAGRVAPRSSVFSRTCPSACEPGCPCRWPVTNLLPNPYLPNARLAGHSAGETMSRQARPRIISSISPRTCPRIMSSIGSNQSSKRWELLSVVECQS